MILSFWCLNPALGFSPITESKPKSILLTSGTLAPLISFENELKTDFPIKLLNNHVIDTKKQVFLANMTHLTIIDSIDIYSDSEKKHK